jgi:hypothetical protein
VLSILTSGVGKNGTWRPLDPRKTIAVVRGGPIVFIWTGCQTSSYSRPDGTAFTTSPLRCKTNYPSGIPPLFCRIFLRRQNSLWLGNLNQTGPQGGTMDLPFQSSFFGSESKCGIGYAHVFTAIHLKETLHAHA